MKKWCLFFAIMKIGDSGCGVYWEEPTDMIRQVYGCRHTWRLVKAIDDYDLVTKTNTNTWPNLLIIAQTSIFAIWYFDFRSDYVGQISISQTSSKVSPCLRKITRDQSSMGNDMKREKFTKQVGLGRELKSPFHQYLTFFFIFLFLFLFLSVSLWFYIYSMLFIAFQSLTLAHKVRTYDTTTQKSSSQTSIWRFWISFCWRHHPLHHPLHHSLKTRHL